MNVHTSSLKVVVKAFELIVKVNTMMKNQKYTHFSKLHKMILIAKKTYQEIIRCDMKFEIILSKRTKNAFVENFIDDDFVKDIHKSEIAIATAKSFHNENLENNNFMIDILIVAANFDTNENLNFSAISFRFRLSLLKKTRNRKFKINKFDNFLRFFNVHVDLHLTDNVREYETIMNVNVFVEKMKHMFNIFFHCLYYFLTSLIEISKR